MEEVVAPPGLHIRVDPGEGETDAERMTEVVVQVRVRSAPALTVGRVMFWLTTTASEVTHPLSVLVTVAV